MIPENQEVAVEEVEVAPGATIQSRLKSRVAWTAIISLLAFILGNYGLYEYIGLNEEGLKTFASLVFAVLTALGIFNNPTDPNKY